MMSPIRELDCEMVKLLERYKQQLRNAGVSRPTNKDASRLLSREFEMLRCMKKRK